MASLQGLKRLGTDGQNALVAPDSPPRIIPPGERLFRDLAPTGSQPPDKPRSTVIEGVSWRSNKKILLFPKSFTGEIASDVATAEKLAYYKAKFANRVDGKIDIPVQHQQTDFTYARDYLHTYVMADKEKGGAGGATLERQSLQSHQGLEEKLLFYWSQHFL